MLDLRPYKTKDGKDVLIIFNVDYSSWCKIKKLIDYLNKGLSK